VQLDRFRSAVIHANFGAELFHWFYPTFGVRMIQGDRSGENTMLYTLGLLLGCQLFGEITARGFGLAMPGPVLGLALLVLLLRTLPKLADRVRPTTTVILANLSFLFVPAGVGVIGNFEVLLDDWLTLLLVLTLSTVLSMLATVGTFIGVRHLIERRTA
jgi:holin-like protein